VTLGLPRSFADMLGFGEAARQDAETREIGSLCEGAAAAILGRQSEGAELRIDFRRDQAELMEYVGVRLRCGERTATGGTSFYRCDERSSRVDELMGVVEALACRLYLPVFRIGRDARRLTR